jgi:hypothetical protein
MPVVLDVAQKCEYVFRSDRDKPNPPTFICSPMTCREWRNAAKLQRDVEGRADGVSVLDEVLACVKPKIIGWRDLTGHGGEAIEFDADKIEDVLGIQDVMEILFWLLEVAVPSAEDRKKSDSPSP